MTWIRNYVYGAQAPLEEAPFWEEVRQIRKYHNELIALENEAHATLSCLRAEHSAAIECLEAGVSAATEAIDQARAAIRAGNARTRQRCPAPLAQLGVQALRESRATLSALLREAHLALRQDLVYQQAAADLYECVASRARRVSTERKTQGPLCQSCAACRRKILRDRPAPYWGNKPLAEVAVQQAMHPPEAIRQKLAHKGIPIWPLAFRCYQRGQGTIRVQVMGGLTMQEAFQDHHGTFRLADRPRRPSQKGQAPQPGSRRSQRHRHVLASLRLGTGPGRQPIWCQVPVLLHRPLPDGARIKEAFLHALGVGQCVKWQLRLILSAPEAPAQVLRPVARAGLVGIDLGWRVRPAGLRVAVWRADTAAGPKLAESRLVREGLHRLDDDEWGGELLLPPDDVTRWAHADSLRSLRDQAFDTIRPLLTAWLPTAPVPVREGVDPRTGVTCDQGLRQRLAHLATWRSPNRLQGVYHWWRQHRFPGDETMFALVQQWARRDRHLGDWDMHERGRCIRWRDDVVRNLVHDLRQHYHTAVIEDTDWSKLAELPQAESDRLPLWARARNLRMVGAPGRLGELIREGFAHVVKVPAANTTRTCHVHGCGLVETWDQGRHLRWTCRNGHHWDQDENAAHVLLARGQAFDC